MHCKKEEMSDDECLSVEAPARIHHTIFRCMMGNYLIPDYMKFVYSGCRFLIPISLGAKNHGSESQAAVVTFDPKSSSDQKRDPVYYRFNMYSHIDNLNANYIQAITYPYHTMLL